jgi:Zn-dependent protease with chaperone function
MTDPRRLFSLSLVLGAAGMALAVGALAVGIGGVTLRASEPASLARACMTIIPRPGVSGIAILALSGIGLAVVVRAGRSCLLQALEQRRLIRALGARRPIEVGGTEAWLIDSPRPEAFCAGLLRPRIFISSATIETLGEGQLAAVMAHEAHHRRQRDPLRLFCVRLLADALFFLPALGRLRMHFAAASEIAADRAGVETAGGARPLASALLALAERSHGSGTLGIAPERVDHLTGHPVRWRTSRLVTRGSWASGLALAGLAVSVAAVGPAGPLSLPLLAAQSCMLAMVAVSIAAGLAAVRWLSPRLRGFSR